MCTSDLGFRSSRRVDSYYIGTVDDIGTIVYWKSLRLLFSNQRENISHYLAVVARSYQSPCVRFTTDKAASCIFDLIIMWRDSKTYINHSSHPKVMMISWFTLYCIEFKYDKQRPLNLKHVYRGALVTVKDVYTSCSD